MRTGYGWHEWLARAGSLQVTLWLIVMLALVVLAVYLLSALASGWVAFPLLLLGINLLAAILSNTKFRQQLPLLSFHLALLALLVLVALSQLSSLKGTAEVTEGEPFSGELTSHRAGPLHHWRLDQVEFLLQGFTIHYAAGLLREETVCTVRWRDQHGEIHQGRIGDHQPLVLAGYRFYTSHNKGFALTFGWWPNNGVEQRGSIHLPAYPAHEFSQAQEWIIPGTTHRLWAQLQFDEVILDAGKPSVFHPPVEHLVIIRGGDQRHELRPGDTLMFDEGRLVYMGLRSWMGFTVSSDWTLPWLLAASLAAVLSIAWYYWERIRRQPWREV